MLSVATCPAALKEGMMLRRRITRYEGRWRVRLGVSSSERNVRVNRRGSKEAKGMLLIWGPMSWQEAEGARRADSCARRNK